MTDFLTGIQAKPLVPSNYLRALNEACQNLRVIKLDPKTPARIETIARLAESRLDEYRLTIALQESVQSGQDLTSSETEAIEAVEDMVKQAVHSRDLCLSRAKKQYFQDQINALRIVLNLAKRHA